jgi:hypothetical protein
MAQKGIILKEPVFISYSQNSSVGIVTGYGLDDRGSIPGGGYEFFSSTPCPDRLWGPPSLLSNGYWELFPLRGVKLTTHLHLVPVRE